MPSLILAQLHRFSPERHLFIGADRATLSWARQQSIHEARLVDVLMCLDKYGNSSRSELEKATSSSGMSQWTLLQLEKATVMSFALQRGHRGVLFCDADVLWTHALPAMVLGTPLGLSEHRTSADQRAAYGHYNGGMIYVSDGQVLEAWRRHTANSRFFEQVWRKMGG
jgi:hypothetical protein